MTERLTVKHTPTPWEVGEFKEQPYVCAEYGGRLVADTFGGTLEEAQANAALIVQAVKAYTDHQAVVAELEAKVTGHAIDAQMLADQLQQATEREAKLREALEAVNGEVCFTDNCVSGCGYDEPGSSAEDCTCAYGLARAALAHNPKG